MSFYSHDRKIVLFSLAVIEVKRKSIRFIDREYPKLIQTVLAGREYL